MCKYGFPLGRGRSFRFVFLSVLVTAVRKTGLPHQQWGCSAPTPQPLAVGAQLPVLLAPLGLSPWLVWAERGRFQSCCDISSESGQSDLYWSAPVRYGSEAGPQSHWEEYPSAHCVLARARWKPVIMWHLKPKFLLILPLPLVLKNSFVHVQKCQMVIWYST